VRSRENSFDRNNSFFASSATDFALQPGGGEIGPAGERCAVRLARDLRVIRRNPHYQTTAVTFSRLEFPWPEALYDAERGSLRRTGSIIWRLREKR
jgi:hypothetical protein